MPPGACSRKGPPEKAFVMASRRAYPAEPDLKAQLVAARLWPIPRGWFKKLRARYRLTQDRTARRLGIGQDTWSRWERDDMAPNLLTFAGILAAVESWPAPSTRRLP